VFIDATTITRYFFERPWSISEVTTASNDLLPTRLELYKREFRRIRVVCKASKSIPFVLGGEGKAMEVCA
jgi:hypothetical protein